VERAFEIPHKFLGWVLGMPWESDRRQEVEGEIVKELQWDGKKWIERSRVAENGGFCGGRELMVMKEDS
jgi:hypothetical protein